MKKKSLLFVVNSLGCGGAEKSLVSLLSVMDFNKYDVDLQMFNPGGMFITLLPKEVAVLPEFPYVQFCREGGLNFCYLKTKIITSFGLRMHPKCNGKPLHDAQCYWKYAQRSYNVAEKQYDAAIAWGQGLPTHYVADKVNAGKKIAFINADYEAVGHNRVFDQPFYEKYDTIALVSDTLHDIMSKVFPDMKEKMTTIYDIRNQSLIEEMSKTENPFMGHNGISTLATVGRMVKTKGYDMAVIAARILRDRGHSFKWYLVGDGPERGYICRQIMENDLREYVISVGAKENPYPYMKNADIYVQTSRAEGFCLTLCEARGLGIPLVSTNFEAAYEQICDGENGLIVEMTPEGIADGIERLLMNNTLRQSIKDQLLKEHIGNETEIEKLYELFEL